MNTATITAAEIDGRPSHEDVSVLIRKALTGGAEVHGPGSPWVVECGDKSRIVVRDGQNYRYPYTVKDRVDPVSPDGQAEASHVVFRRDGERLDEPEVVEPPVVHPAVKRAAAPYS